MEALQLELGSKVRWVKGLQQFEEVWVERVGCGGSEWTDNVGSEAGRY